MGSRPHRQACSRCYESYSLERQLVEKTSSRKGSGVRTSPSSQNGWMDKATLLAALRFASASTSLRRRRLGCSTAAAPQSNPFHSTPTDRGEKRQRRCYSSSSQGQRGRRRLPVAPLPWLRWPWPCTLLSRSLPLFRSYRNSPSSVIKGSVS